MLEASQQGILDERQRKEQAQLREIQLREEEAQRREQDAKWVPVEYSTLLQ